MTVGTQFAIQSQRQAGQFVLQATNVDVAGAAFFYTGALPNGFGDCLLLEVHLRIQNIGTVATLSPNVGAEVLLMDGAPNVMDFVGSNYWKQTQAGSVVMTVVPDQTRIWKSTEILGVASVAVETSTTAGDLSMYALVRRLRDQ